MPRYFVHTPIFRARLPAPCRRSQICNVKKWFASKLLRRYPSRSGPLAQDMLTPAMIQMALRLQADIERSSLLVKGLRTLSISSRLDRGCLRSEVLLDANDPSRVYYFEDWESAEELNRQIRSEQFTRLLALMEAASEPPEFQFRFIDTIHGLEYVEAQRG